VKILPQLLHLRAELSVAKGLCAGCGKKERALTIRRAPGMVKGRRSLEWMRVHDLFFTIYGRSPVSSEVGHRSPFLPLHPQ